MAHEKTKNVVLVILSLIVAALIIEGVLRVLGWGFLYLQGKEDGGFTLTTDVQPAHREGIKLRLVEQKEVVVLCIGESTTGLGGINSWPRQLQRILNSIQDQRTFRVINKGIPAIDTRDILKSLPDYLDQYEPDLVLAMVGINDDNDRHKFPAVESFLEQSRSNQNQWTEFVRNFRIYGLIEWIAGGMENRFTGKAEDAITPEMVRSDGNGGKLTVYGLRYPDVTDLHPLTIRNLNDMVSLTAEQEIDFVFVQYPLRKTDILKDVIQRHAIYISNYEIFTDLLEQYSYEDLFWDEFAFDFGHATIFGNRVIADNVAQQLLVLFKSF
jgi:lysophospholipase L1-like esterase